MFVFIIQYILPHQISYRLASGCSVHRSHLTPIVSFWDTKCTGITASMQIATTVLRPQQFSFQMMSQISNFTLEHELTYMTYARPDGFLPSIL